MSDALPWADASAACQAAGQQLATVQSAEQNALLLAAARGNNEVWIGGTDAASEGTWVWSPSNTPLSYTNWYPGEPNNSGGEDCLEFQSNRLEKQWNDEGCTSKRKYVCQTACPVPPPPPSPSPPPSSPPGTFAIRAFLETAAKAFNANKTAAIATYGSIADWDVSAIKDMTGLFYELENVNEDISSWDTSGVTSMESMFYVRSARALGPQP
jgi:surface protein